MKFGDSKRHITPTKVILNTDFLTTSLVRNLLRVLVSKSSMQVLKKVLVQDLLIS